MGTKNVIVSTPFGNKSVKISDKCTVMQYTGFKDKFGTEIYAGDLMRIVGGEFSQGFYEVDINGKVVTKHGSFGVEDEEGNFHPFVLMLHRDDVEIFVYGNIFEQGNDTIQNTNLKGNT